MKLSYRIVSFAKRRAFLLFGWDIANALISLFFNCLFLPYNLNNGRTIITYIQKTHLLLAKFLYGKHIDSLFSGESNILPFLGI